MPKPRGYKSAVVPYAEAMWDIARDLLNILEASCKRRGCKKVVRALTWGQLTHWMRAHDAEHTVKA